MLEVITDINTGFGNDGQSVLYFAEDSDPAPARAAILAFWEFIENSVQALTSITVRQEGRILDPVTGNLTGFWSSPNAVGAQMAGAGAPSPDASQALVRWRTGNIVGNRVVQGRMFIPQIVQDRVVGGNLAPAAVSEISVAAATLAANAADLVIWSRPTPERPGEMSSVTSSSVWTEMAVLRRRRG